jgi:L-fuculose-phosphate aldolase
MRQNFNFTPGELIPEQKVCIGPVAITPYETPGTKQFAETVLPFVSRHNTILLGNHRIVCWADTVTRAEWLVEVAGTYCRTIMLASSVGAPITHIAPDKVADLLEIKKKLGLPGCRYEEESTAGESVVGALSLRSNEKKVASGNGNKGGISAVDVDRVISNVTAQVLDSLSREE